MVGLDNAGKTTILYQFLMNEVVHTSPTIGSNVEEVVWRNIHFLVWDLGGQQTLRAAWSTYYTNTEVNVPYSEVQCRILQALYIHSNLISSLLLWSSIPRIVNVWLWLEKNFIVCCNMRIWIKPASWYTPINRYLSNNDNGYELHCTALKYVYLFAGFKGLNVGCRNLQTIGFDQH